MGHAALLAPSIRSPFCLLCSLTSPLRAVSADGATSDPSALETLFPTVFALCGESVEKLQLGKTKTATTFYESHIVVQAALFPLVLAIVAKADANAAALDVAAMELAKALEPLRVAAENA